MVGLSIGALQQKDVEHGRVDGVEAQALRAARQIVVQRRARPVEHGHEIVADGPDTGGGKDAKALGPGVGTDLPARGAGLDVLVHGNAFDHDPVEPRVADHVAPRLDVLVAPDGARRNAMQRRDDTLGPGLPDIVQGHGVVGAEPAPGLDHVLPFQEVVSSAQALRETGWNR